MNCNHFQELLPLYAGRDLDGQHFKLVAAHLQICPACTASVQEYGDTLRLVQEFAPPVFAESAYTAIRRQVLSEIEKESQSPNLAQIIANYLRPVAGLAVATALLVSLALSAFYFVSTTNKHESQIADSRVPTLDARDEQSDEQRTGGQTNESSVPDMLPKNERPAIPPQGNGIRPTAGRANRIHRSGRFMAKRPTASPNRIDPKTAVPFPAANNMAVTPTTMGPEKTLRMEMQTKDPNIRIIWFSNLPAKQGSRN